MSYNSVIASNDSMKLTKLLENKEFFEQRNEYMQNVNDYYAEHGTVVGCPGIENDTAHNLNSRVKEGQSGPYPEQFFKENQEQIDRLNNMIDRLAEKPETLFNGWQFAGGEAVVNLANNRLQLMFDDKPSDEQINALKRHGFHWARTAKAWQRPLTHKAMSAADKIDFVKPLDGKKPTEHQPQAPKHNEPER